MEAVILASTPSSMDIINTMGSQPEADPSLRSELGEVSEEEPTQNTDHQLVCDTTGELLIALGSLSKYSSLIAAVNEALAESTDAASLLQAATRRMLAVRRAARAVEAQHTCTLTLTFTLTLTLTLALALDLTLTAQARRAEERALAAAKLELEERLRADVKAEADREAAQHAKKQCSP